MRAASDGTERTSGILLHPTSLPGPFARGDIGEWAYRFIDFLAESRQSVWQVLPLGPPGAGQSPYDARSALAGDPMLIAIEPLCRDGLLDEADLRHLPAVEDVTRADLTEAESAKLPLLRRAWQRAAETDQGALLDDFNRFVVEEADWLDAYTLYQSLREAHGGLPWYEWEPGLVGRESETLDQWRTRLSDEIRFQQFLQFLFARQWSALRAYANERGIRVMGDIPIYVARDSADVWAHQDLFTIDASGSTTRQAGVPPDLFASTGQLWGNPCYQWAVHAATGYQWWIDRFRHALRRYDLMRVDHFRGFVAGWQVPAGEPTAIAGDWVAGPGLDIFQRAAEALGRLPIVVEDLGVITPDVDALRLALGYPGMRVLQFAFGDDSRNPYLPHNYDRNTVVYTGTHDNDTAVGWFRSCSEHERQRVTSYLGTSGEDIGWDLARLALASVANSAIIPLQDLLGLGSEARMNLPGTAEGNWTWRARNTAFTRGVAERLAALVTLYGRDVGR